MKNIGYYENIKQYSTIIYYDLDDLFKLLQNNSLKNDIWDLRAEYSTNGKSEHYKNMKNDLPCFIVAAKMNEQKASLFFEEYNYMIILDFDNISNVHDVFIKISRDVYSALCFISPTGNGIKLIVEIEKNDDLMSKEDFMDYHLNIFNFLKEHYATVYDIEADTSCKNINRLCFMTYCQENEIYQNDLAIKVKIAKKKKIGQLINSTSVNTQQIKPFVLDQDINLPDHTISKNVKSESASIDKMQIMLELFERKYLKTPMNNKLGYGLWIKLCWSIISGIQGDRQDISIAYTLFLRFSKLDTTFVDENIVKSQFNSCFHGDKNCKKSKITFGTFFKVCEDMDKDLYEEYLSIRRKKFGEATLEDIEEILIEENIYREKDEILAKIDNIIINDEVFKDDETIRNMICTKYFCKYNKKFIHQQKAINTYIDSFDRIKYSNYIKDHLEAIIDPTLTVETAGISLVLYAIETMNQVLFKDYLYAWSLGVFQTIFEKSTTEEILVFTGNQGCGKTYFIKEQLNCFWRDLGLITSGFSWHERDKDNLFKLTEKVIAIDEEGDNLSVSDFKRIKAVSSTSSIDERQSYGKRNEDYKRISSFIISTNDETFLNDITGNRRFLVNTIITKDQSLMNQFDSAKYWSYFYQLYLKGERSKDYLPSYDTINEDNEKYRNISNDEVWLKLYTTPSKEFMPNYLIEDLFKQYRPDSNRGMQSISGILKKLGYQKEIRKFAGKTCNGYYLKFKLDMFSTSENIDFFD